VKILALILPLLFIGGDALAQREKEADAHRAQAEKLREQLRSQEQKYDDVKVRLKRHESEGNGKLVAKDRDELKKLKSQIRDTKWKIKEERRKAREAERGEPKKRGAS